MTQRIKDLQSFFGNPGKFDREIWLAKSWCSTQGIMNPTISPGGDPPDVIINNQIQIEMVEILPPDRKRTAELYEWERRATQGESPLIAVLPKEYSRLDIIKPNARFIIQEAITKKIRKYSCVSNAQDWTLLCYVNLPWKNRFDWNSILKYQRSSLGTKIHRFRTIDLIWEDSHGRIALRRL